MLLDEILHVSKNIILSELKSNIFLYSSPTTGSPYSSKLMAEEHFYLHFSEYCSKDSFGLFFSFTTYVHGQIMHHWINI